MSKKTIQEIAHRTCRRYKHNSPIPKDLTKAEYIFDDFTLIEFVDKLIEMKRKRNKMNKYKIEIDPKEDKSQWDLMNKELQTQEEINELGALLYITSIDDEPRISNIVKRLNEIVFGDKIVTLGQKAELRLAGDKGEIK